MRRAKKRTQNKHAITDAGAKALAAGAAFAAGTQAYAAPVRFENPDHGELGHFHWWEDWLDVTLSADGQGGSGGIKFLQTWLYYPAANPSYVDGSTSLAEVLNYDSSSYWYRHLLAFEMAEAIPGTAGEFHHKGIIAYSPSYSPLPVNADVYLGTRIQLEGQWHYGWIGVNFNGYAWDSLEAFAWGYETEPGVPIAAGAVPEPETLAMLALGFVGIAAHGRLRCRAREN